MVGPWRIEERLGSGGMGVVYAATDGVRVAALKLIHPHLLAQSGVVERLLREAEAGSRVRHENVVATLGAVSFVRAGAPCHGLVMERVEGQTLRSMLGELGRLPEDLCRHLGREIARGLSAIHSAGIIHRDLKPDNVIVTREHVVKVMDLGLALVADEAARLSQSGTFVGSFHYAAPEQFRRGGRTLDHRTDLHALGVLLHELATGTHPYAAEDLHESVRLLLSARPRRASEVVPQLSPFFDEVVQRLLEKDPAARFASAAEIESVLAEGESGAWWVERARAIRAETRGPLRRVRVPRETAIHGRDGELARLQEAFDRAKSGEGSVVLVEGEAGIGKSRLVDELVARLHAAGEDVNFLVGSYPPGGAATASGAFTTAYREHLGGDEAAVREVLPTTPLLVPAFAALLRGDAAPAGSTPLSQDSIQTVFVHATRALAAQRPTVVLIDDLHFAPDQGRALFMSLALAVPGHRVLLVGCTRQGLDAKWLAALARLPQTTRVPVPRLGREDLVRLISDALRSQRLAEEIGGLIAVKSDGNPFFVFELLRGLRDGKRLRQLPDGTWEATVAIRDVEVPSSIADLVHARIADLAREDRDLLDVAACCGFEFDPEIVGVAAGVERISALRALARLERTNRLVRGAGRRFAFDHHQLQETLYRSIPEALRVVYHGAIARAIEARHAGESISPERLGGAECLVIADHLVRAGCGDRALPYARPALAYLESGFRNEEFVALLDGLLECARTLTDPDRAELLARKAAKLDLMGRRAAGGEALDAARRLVEPDGPPTLRARVAAALGHHLWTTGSYAEAVGELTRALALAGECDDQFTRLRATGVLGNVYHSLGSAHEARAQYVTLLALARTAGNRVSEGTAEAGLANVCFALGRLDDAQQHQERALSIALDTGDRNAQAHVVGNLGNLYWILGRFEEARSLMEQRLRLAREIGARSLQTSATSNLALLFDSLGRTAEAKALCHEALRLAREVGDRFFLSCVHSNLGALLDELGAAAEGRTSIEMSLEIAREIGSRSLEADAVRAMAQWCMNAGRFGESILRYDDALAISRSVDDSLSVALCLVGRSKARASAGDLPGARADALAADEIARSCAAPVVGVLAAVQCAVVGAGDVAAAVEAVSRNEARLGVRERMEVRYSLWRVTGVGEHLSRAKELLDHLVTHAPAEHRRSMLREVRACRAVAEAVAAGGR